MAGKDGLAVVRDTDLNVLVAQHAPDPQVAEGLQGFPLVLQVEDKTGLFGSGRNRGGTSSPSSSCPRISTRTRPWYRGMKMPRLTVVVTITFASARSPSGSAKDPP